MHLFVFVAGGCGEGGVFLQALHGRCFCRDALLEGKVYACVFTSLVSVLVGMCIVCMRMVNTLTLLLKLRKNHTVHRLSQLLLLISLNFFYVTI